MAQVAYKAIGTVASGSTNSLSPSLPSGWSAGDLAIVYGFAYNNITWDTITDWTTIISEASSGNGSLIVAWRVLQAGDGDPTVSYTGTSNSFVARVFTVENHDPSSPFDLTPAAVSFSVGSSWPYDVDFTEITTLTNNSLVAYIYGIKDNISSTITNLTERADDGTSSGSDCQCAMATKEMASAGGCGTSTATYGSSGSGDDGWCAKLAIKPITTLIKTINGLAKASVKTNDGLAIASMKTLDGLA